MTHIATHRHPRLSLFQSAVDAVSNDRANLRKGAPLTAAAGKPTMSDAAALFASSVENQVQQSRTEQDVNEAAAAVTFTPAPAVTAAATTSAPGVDTVTPSGFMAVVAECAKLAFMMGEAKLFGNDARAAQIEAELKDNACDPMWFEASLKYIEYYKLGMGQAPYRVWTNISDFVINDLPANATIAFVADWGTGTPGAEALLQEIGEKNPDILFHLGDIYYAGTQPETDTFLEQCKLVMGNKQIYTLSGNHDMYSGGHPYYNLLDQIGQPASYFCLRNDNWQFLSMDTGLHDNNPNIIDSIMTYLEPTEVEWHLDKISSAAGRKTVFLSHHQLFTACSDIAGGSTNTKLEASFQGVLSQISLWLWGHEHNMVQYGPYAGLQRGRCIGCGAIPVFTSTLPYKPNFTDVPMLPPRLGTTAETYNHGYAIMTLNGPTATVQYFDVTQPGNPLFTDQL